MVGDGLLQVVRPFASDALGVGARQVVLGRCPILREGFAGAHRQRLLVVGDGPLQIVGPLAADALGISYR